MENNANCQHKCYTSIPDSGAVPLGLIASLVSGGVILCAVFFCGCGFLHRPASQTPLGPAWVSNPSLAGKLGPEVKVMGYGIRPPAGYTKQRITLTAPDGGGLRCIWTGPAGADGVKPYLQMDAGADNGGASSRINSDYNVRIGFAAEALNHKRMVFSHIEQGSINGLLFSRGYWKGYGVKTGKRFHGLVYGRVDSPNLVTITGRDGEPSYLHTLPLLEASALTVRKL